MRTRKKILVVDDDQPILEVIKIILEDKGYQVHISTKAEMIDSLIRYFSPDLIFLDIWMSGCDGRSITKRLKYSPHTKAIPIVLISALSETKEIAQQSGAEGYLSKPFDIADLINIVEKFTQSPALLTK